MKRTNLTVIDGGLPDYMKTPRENPGRDREPSANTTLRIAEVLSLLQDEIERLWRILEITVTIALCAGGAYAGWILLTQ